MENCNFQRDLNELFSPQQSAPPRLAAESTQLARHQILMNASTEMLKQANILPQNALRLILGL